MMFCTVFQLGGMVGTVGQSLNAAWPEGSYWLATAASNLSSDAARLVWERKEYPWAIVTCFVTIALIYRGTYRRIEWLTTLIVVAVTIMTVVAAGSLWFTPFAFDWKDLAGGLVFHIPESGIADAFAIFGITGVGATGSFYYPYWCLEKGYAATFVGPFDGSPGLGAASPRMGTCHVFGRMGQHVCIYAIDRGLLHHGSSSSASAKVGSAEIGDDRRLIEYVWGAFRSDCTSCLPVQRDRLIQDPAVFGLCCE